MNRHITNIDVSKRHMLKKQ